MPSSQPTHYFPNPLHSSPLSAEKAVNMHAKATGGHGIGSPCKPPSRVQRVRSAIRDDGAAAAGTGMCRLRRSVRPVGRDEGTREAGGLPGEKTFGDFWSFKSHSPQPEGRAKHLRGQGPRVLHGEAMPLRRRTIFSREMTLAPLTLTLSRKGRGDQSAGHRGLSRSQRLKRCRGKRHKQKPQPKGCGFLLAQPVGTSANKANRP